jgi:putative membrane protein
VIRRPVTTAAGAATALAAIAFPLASRGGAARRAVSQGVVVGLATTTTAAVTARWRPARSSLAGLAVLAGTAAVERLGTATGVPFGRYRYSGALRPEVAGVPAVVPLAWWAMAVPAREAAHAALGPVSGPVSRIGLGAVALTAWDLFLDPQMTAEGYWLWWRPGRYRGIPLSNYAGWLASGVAVMALLEAVLPAGGPDAALVVEYAVTAAMEALGFAAFLGDRLVATVGGVAMLPIAGLAVARLLRAARG